MKKRQVMMLVSFCLAIAMMVGCTAQDNSDQVSGTEETDSLKDVVGDEMTVAVVGNKAPYYEQTEDGYDGCDIDFLKAVCEEADISISWTSISESDIDSALEDDDIDYILLSDDHTWGSTELNDAFYAMPMLNCNIYLWIDTSDAGSLMNVDYLMGKTAAADPSIGDILTDYELGEQIRERLADLDDIVYVDVEEIREYDVYISGAWSETARLSSELSALTLYSEKHQILSSDRDKMMTFYKEFIDCMAEGVFLDIIETYQGQTGFLDSCDIDIDGVYHSTTLIYE